MYRGLFATLVLFVAAASAQEDNLGGLAAGPGAEEVYYTCSACHSLAMVKQQRLDRDTWGATLDWMVYDQGMAELDADERELILNYLATYLGRDVPR